MTSIHFMNINSAGCSRHNCFLNVMRKEKLYNGWSRTNNIDYDK